MRLRLHNPAYNYIIESKFHSRIFLGGVVAYAEVGVVLLDLVELESENLELLKLKNTFFDSTTVV